MDFQIFCPHGCGEVVKGTDAGFAATSVTVDACSALRADGVVNSEMRKSAAYAAMGAYERQMHTPYLRGNHKDALVVLR